VCGTDGDDSVEFWVDAVGMKGRGLGRFGNVDGPPPGGGADVGRSRPGAAFIVLCMSAVASFFPNDDIAQPASAPAAPAAELTRVS